MKPSDYLHQLIKSLTGSEKRYFKLFAKRHVVGSQNKYELLFNVYDELPDDHYDDKLLKEKLKAKGLGKNLADDKKNLQEMIMKAMLSFHAGNTIDTQLNNLLAEEDFYRQKRLNDLRRKTIAKAKDLAEKYEKYLVLVELADRETKMKMEIQQESLSELAERIGHEENKWLGRMNLRTDLVNLSNWLFIQYRINAKKDSPDFWMKAEQQMLHPTFKNYEPGTSFRGDNAYYLIWAFYHALKKDYKKHNYYTRLQYELYEKYYPHQKESDRLSYRISLFNYLYSLQTIKDFEGMEKLLDHAETISPLNDDEAGESFQNLVFYRQLYYMNTLQFEKAIEMVPKIEEGIKKYNRKVNIARKLTLYSNIAISYMILGMWDYMLKYTEKIIIDKTEVRLDIKQEAMLHQLIAWYESKQYELLLYKLRNTQRYFATKGVQNPSAQYVLRLIQLMIKDEKACLNNLKKDLGTAMQNSSDYSAIQIWLYARIHNIKMVAAANIVNH